MALGYRSALTKYDASKNNTDIFGNPLAGDNVDAYGMELGTTYDSSGVPEADTSWSMGGFDDWTGKDYINTGLGVTQGAMGLLNYRQNKKFNEKRINALDEQIASSQYARGRHQQFVSNVGKSGLGYRGA